MSESENRQLLGMSRDENFAADIDIRMMDLFEFFEMFDDEARVWAIAIARTAYAMGYEEAFAESRFASLFLDNGYGIPDRES